MPRASAGLWLLACAAACAHHTDIRGDNDAAREWAEREREAQRNQPAPQPPPPANGAATPEARPLLPEQAPPPRRTTSTSSPWQQRPAAGPTAATPGRGTGQRIGVGTCFAIDAQGTVATAQHVVAGARRIAVRLADGTVLDATLQRASEATDVALLKIEHATKDFLALGEHDAARVGGHVFTVGYPTPDLLGTEPKFSDGSISALSGVRGDAAAMQITVPIQPGNSGGPLLDERGAVLGVVVARAADSAFYDRTGALPQNVNFASKADNLRTLLNAAPKAPPAPARTREDAVERALRAVCLVLAVE